MLHLLLPQSLWKEALIYVYDALLVVLAQITSFRNSVVAFILGFQTVAYYPFNWLNLEFFIVS